MLWRTHGRAEERTHGRTTRKHNASDTPIGERRHKKYASLGFSSQKARPTLTISSVRHRIVTNETQTNTGEYSWKNVNNKHTQQFTPFTVHQLVMSYHECDLSISRHVTSIVKLTPNSTTLFKVTVKGAVHVLNNAKNCPFDPIPYNTK